MIRVVYEDDDLIAVDKPEGVPCQAADPDHPDDLPYRLKLDRGLAYLGVHQRLDRDTSGILVYAKRKTANKSLAEQFEAHRVEKRHVALVEGDAGQGRLEHRVARTRDGRTEVVSATDRRGAVAVTHVERMRSEGRRALLALHNETGGAHPIRAQLAAVGAPVVGDGLYGGATASRLMLHASSISLRHPVTDEPLCIEAPAPALFASMLHADRDPFDDLAGALESAAERRFGLARRDDVDAYRLVNEAGDGLPGLAIDVYGPFCVVHAYDEALPLERVLDRVDARGVYLKRRPKRANEIVGAHEGLAPRDPVRGEPAPDPFVIRENGVPFVVRLGEGLHTGIFLDQRENRRRVRELAEGRRVLNLFAHTGAFTVSAALGGAAETLSVDASARLLAKGRESLRNAGVDDEHHRFEVADCLVTLRALADRGERFDLVIVDPPTYSTTKSTRWKSGAEWRELARLALSVLAPGGTLLSCTNDRRMSGGVFRRYVSEGARDANVELAALKSVPCPADFPAPSGQEAHLKTLLATLA